MKHVQISLENARAPVLPDLGHGLWVNRLDDPAAVQVLIGQLAGAHLDLLVDLRAPDAFEKLGTALALCNRTQTQAWLLVIVDDETAQDQLKALAAALQRAVVRPEGILLTPAAYLNSYQPDAQWPTGPCPDDLARLGRAILPGLRIGGGVPTYFTELNRCRPDPELFDYLTHATSPIVHAADDLSAMECLEALPDIVRSGRALAHGKPYRLTTSAIGAWCNPYGGKLTPNPERLRLTLSDRDPRQRGLFAAAWTLGHYAAVQRAGVDAVALWAVNEPFVAAEPACYWPVFHTLRGLNRGRGKTAVRVSASSQDLAVVGWEEGEEIRLWLANLTDREHSVELPGLCVSHYALLDADNCAAAQLDPEFMLHTAQPLSGIPPLTAYAVLTLVCRRGVECGL